MTIAHRIARTRARLAVIAVLGVTAHPVTAQTRAQIEAEPIVKLRAGETLVAGQCLTREELDLLDSLTTLRRPTVGVESDGDDPAPFDPHYFVGTWEIEGVLPDSPLGEAGEFYGTESVRHLEGCSYESTIEAGSVDSPVRVDVRTEYDRRAQYMVRLEEDSRGPQYMKVGRVGGDPGGYFSHHWQAAPVTSGGQRIRLAGRTFITSPDNYEVQMRIAMDGGDFANFGRLRWRRVIEDEP